MKKIVSALLALIVTTASAALYAAETYKPFILAYTQKAGTVQSVSDEVSKKLAAAGFEIVGSYSPFDGATVIGVTNGELKANAAKSEFGGYGVVQRVSVTKVGDEIQVAYTNPTYMSNAYRMEGDLAGVTKKMEATLGNKVQYGMEEGLPARKLRKYHYMFGMEYFDDLNMHLVATHKSYEEAVKTVEANLAKGVQGVTKVWRVDVPGKQETVFGTGMKMPANGNKNMDDKYLMSEIDFQPIRSTAHLPYELLVSGNKVYSLYARFRIAVNFPDLSMVGDNSFMRIMDAPEAIRKAHTVVSGGEWAKSDYY